MLHIAFLLFVNNLKMLDFFNLLYYNYKVKLPLWRFMFFMKKLACLLLCLVFSLTFLVGCSSVSNLDEDLERYKQDYKPEVRDYLELDFYIIADDITVANGNAIDTVERYINAHLQEKFNTVLDIHFVSASAYESEVNAAVNATDAKERADIVLIAGENMFNSLYESHALANITDFYKSDKFGRLNSLITSTLLDASVKTEQRIKAGDSNEVYNVDYFYSVPNDHVIGSYEYVIVNRAIAEELNYSPDKIKAMNTYELTEALRADIDNKLKLNSADYVKYVTERKYEDKAAYEAEGYYCNVAKYPMAGTAEAFKSAYAVVRAIDDLSYQNNKDELITDETVKKETPAYVKHYERCMEVIYALNTDSELVNLLLYGKEGTNSTYNETTGLYTPIHEGVGAYKVDKLYVGNSFISGNSLEYGWDDTVKANGKKQNAESYNP